MTEEQQKKIEMAVKNYSMTHDKNTDEKVFSPWSFKAGAALGLCLAQERLDEAERVIQKYADGYVFDEPDDDTEQLHADKLWRHTSGKTAREYLSKWGK